MEKKRLDYILLLIFMLLSYLSITVLGRMYPVGTEIGSRVNILTYLIVFAWYVCLYRVTTNFYPKKIVRWSIVIAMAAHFTYTTFVIQRYGTAASDVLVPITISWIGSLLGFGIVFFIVTKDIFTKRHDLTYSLLGASNIYFMIPLVFCYIYAIISLHDPSYVHADPSNIGTVLYHSFDYSWYIIAGIDYTAGKIGDVIQSIAVLEALAGNLFIVFIIGRLMSGPGVQ